jgi:hypothetical protein
VISNVVNDELGLAPEDLRREILDEFRHVEFELAVEDSVSARLFAAYVTGRIVQAAALRMAESSGPTGGRGGVPQARP